MIQANELRIGNWVNLDWDGDISPQQVGTIGCEHISTIEFSDEDFRLNNISPIPLTPEILEKCFGFTRRFPTDDCNIWDFGKEITLARLVDGWKYLTAPGSKLFQYVHQFQNLYFALRHTDITINI